MRNIKTDKTNHEATLEIHQNELHDIMEILDYTIEKEERAVLQEAADIERLNRLKTIRQNVTQAWELVQ
jgi:hypothetical protein